MRFLLHAGLGYRYCCCCCTLENQMGLSELLDISIYNGIPMRAAAQNSCSRILTFHSIPRPFRPGPHASRRLSIARGLLMFCTINLFVVPAAASAAGAMQKILLNFRLLINLGGARVRGICGARGRARKY